MKQKDYPVCVLCPTYNHAPFIEETMNGFTMQETDFSYVCCIIDDASTDEEPYVIQRYLQDNFALDDHITVRNEETDDYYLCFAQHRKNYNCYFVVLLLKYNHYGSPQMAERKMKYIAEWSEKAKYLAVCEGDDYWIDAHKLQRQFDLLEHDNTISMCHHNYKELLVDGSVILRKRNVPERQDLLSISKYNPTQTLTMFFRNIQPLIPKELENRVVYSQFWAMRLAEYGDIYYIDEPMAVYRRNPQSIYGTKDAFTKFKMSLQNIDNMIFWYGIIKRKDVIYTLSVRARRTSFRYALHFMRRFQVRKFFKALYYSYKYYLL